jgi:hypothetical protein
MIVAKLVLQAPAPTRGRDVARSSMTPTSWLGGHQGGSVRHDLIYLKN